MVLGDVVTFEYLDKRLAIPDRLDAMINRLYKKLADVRAIKIDGAAQLAADIIACLPPAAAPFLENPK